MFRLDVLFMVNLNVLSLTPFLRPWPFSLVLIVLIAAALLIVFIIFQI